MSGTRLTEGCKAARTPDDGAGVVVQAYEAFAGRPVRDFVPVHVERKTRAVLGKPPDLEG
ncbi:three-helix bundle dimerization domain-containing protein [Streptomyces sp. NPDC057694]|uniref:three-helix bundle dimerization domain-containing protein n=1 Tax=Streptomyces sp. NPDC057694 TaxID=3346216 RepID=UPI0036CAEB5C